jgi:hypothetical protein
MPALATIVFRGPSSLTLVSTSFCTSERFETSAVTAIALRPMLLISLTTPSACDWFAAMSFTQIS